MSVYRFISAEKARTPVSICCELLGVRRSGFYDWLRRAPSDRALSDAWLTEKIKAIHQANRGVYGARRVHAELRLAQGVRVGRKRVERLMRQAGISGLVKRRKGRTTIRVPGVRVADDLVARQFRPAAPNVLWVADITYLRTWEGWLYFAAVQDAFSRRIVGSAMADHMRSELVVDALQMALAPRKPGPGLVHHSDQGSQPGLKGPSQHRVIGKRTVAGSIAWLGRGDGCGWLSSRRLARRAGRSGDNHPRGRRFPGSLERVSLVQRAVQRATVRCSSSTSAGVFHPSVLRGLVLSASATAARSSAL